MIARENLILSFIKRIVQRTCNKPLKFSSVFLLQWFSFNVFLRRQNSNVQNIFIDKRIDVWYSCSKIEQNSPIYFKIIYLGKTKREKYRLLLFCWFRKKLFFFFSFQKKKIIKKEKERKTQHKSSYLCWLLNVNWVPYISILYKNFVAHSLQCACVNVLIQLVDQTLNCWRQNRC